MSTRSTIAMHAEPDDPVNWHLYREYAEPDSPVKLEISSANFIFEGRVPEELLAHFKAGKDEN